MERESSAAVNEGNCGMGFWQAVICGLKFRYLGDTGGTTASV